MLREPRRALLAGAAAALAAGAAVSQRRGGASFERVTPHMSLLRGSGADDGGGGKAKSPAATADKSVGQRPLVVMLPWLLAKGPHVAKYARLYTERGLDVLGVHSHPGHLLRPVKGSQVVAAELLQYLKDLPGRAPLLLHGFSVGGYIWGEALVQLGQQSDLRETLEKRFIGQIWDSVVELTEAPAGLARSVFPRTIVLQNILEKVINTYLAALYQATTRHYELSSQHFHRHPLHCPALLLLSRSDPIGTVSANEKLMENWRKIDVPTYVKIWEGSPHVGHFRMYRAEYEDQINQFLQKLGLVEKK